MRIQFYSSSDYMRESYVVNVSSWQTGLAICHSIGTTNTSRNCLLYCIYWQLRPFAEPHSTHTDCILISTI